MRAALRVKKVIVWPFTKTNSYWVAQASA